MSTMNVEVFGPYGQHFHVHGDQSGAEGVWMAQNQVEGLIEAPIRTAWDSAAQQIGGSMKGMWRDVRDIALGFHCVPVDGIPVEEVEDEFRQCFVFREDEWDHDAKLPRIAITTDQWGTRYLDVQMWKHVDFNPGTDYFVTEHANPIIQLRAGQPNWYKPAIVTTWDTEGGASGSGSIPVANPSMTVPMLPKLVLTPGVWVTPDVSWAGPPGARVLGVDKWSGRDDSARTITVEVDAAVNGGATIDWEGLVGKELLIRDNNGTNMLGQLPTPGKYWSHMFPTAIQEGASIPISVTGATGGATAQLIQPRLFERPIGGELAEEGS